MKVSDCAKRGPHILVAILGVCSLAGCYFSSSVSGTYDQRRWESANLRGKSLASQNRCGQALASFKEALRHAERRGDHAEHQASTLASIADCYRNLGDIDKSESSYMRALAVLDASLQRSNAPENTRALNTQKALYLNRLGALLLENGKINDAETRLADSVALYRTLGASKGAPGRNQLLDRDYADALYGLMKVKIALRKETEAKQHCDELLAPTIFEICPAALAETVKLQKSSFLRKEGKHEEASNLLSEEQFVTALKSGQTSKRKGNHAEAELFFREALEKAQSLRRPNYIATAAEKLGYTLLDQGQTTEAVHQLQVARNNLSPSGADAAIAKNRLLEKLVYLNGMEPLPIVEPQMKEWLAIQKQLALPLYMVTETEGDIASIYLYRKEYEKATEMINRAMKTFRSLTIADRSQGARTLWRLGDVLLTLGRLGEAKFVFESLPLTQVKGHDLIIGQARTAYRIALCNQIEGNSSVADQTRAKALSIIDRAGDIERLRVANSLACLSAMLQRRGKTKEAKMLVPDMKSLTAKTRARSTQEETLLANTLAALNAIEGKSSLQVGCSCWRFGRIETKAE